MLLLWSCDRGRVFITSQIFRFALPLNQGYICNVRKRNSAAGNSSKAPHKNQTVKSHSGAGDRSLAPVNSSVWGRAPVHTLHLPLISRFQFQNNPHPASPLSHVQGGDRQGGEEKVGQNRRTAVTSDRRGQMSASCAPVSCPDANKWWRHLFRGAGRGAHRFKTGAQTQLGRIGTRGWRSHGGSSSCLSTPVCANT